MNLNQFHNYARIWLNKDTKSVEPESNEEETVSDEEGQSEDINELEN